MNRIVSEINPINALCPACKRPLVSGKTVSGGIAVWCPWGDCDTMADGPNEGGHGASEQKALNVLLAKLGLKDYEIELPEPTDEPTDSQSTAAPVGEKKKRGRKAKNETVEFQVPPGEFTMKEFCDLNKTYPYKSLPFFKERKIREVGKRPTASGRGKPAILYSE